MRFLVYSSNIDDSFNKNITEPAVFISFCAIAAPIEAASRTGTSSLILNRLATPSFQKPNAFKNINDVLAGIGRNFFK